jgi:uncharacterized membrane protein YbjE (DUF340 family)
MLKVYHRITCITRPGKKTVLVFFTYLQYIPESERFKSKTHVVQKFIRNALFLTMSKQRKRRKNTFLLCCCVLSSVRVVVVVVCCCCSVEERKKRKKKKKEEEQEEEEEETRKRRSRREEEERRTKKKMICCCVFGWLVKSLFIFLTRVRSLSPLFLFLF